MMKLTRSCGSGGSRAGQQSRHRGARGSRRDHIKKPVLLLRRFDREGKRRIPFLSAMSMLDQKTTKVEAIWKLSTRCAQHGSAPKADMAALWRRMVFNILISNTDDHLRNHGFLYAGQEGWRLSPAYDLNPCRRH